MSIKPTSLLHQKVGVPSMPITKDDMIKRFVDDGLTASSIDEGLHKASRFLHTMQPYVNPGFFEGLFDSPGYICRACQASLAEAEEGFAYGTSLRGSCLGGKTK